MASFCRAMNMPCMTKTAYYQQVENVLEAVEAEVNEEMKNAGQQLHSMIVEENEGVTDDDVVDVAVSFDGTWAKRGFTSLIGVVFVISVGTGEVLDYEILSKECQQCSIRKA